MITSVETTPGGYRPSESGVLKEVRDPVIVLLGAVRNGNTLSCSVASFHAGLEPGAYEMSDGTRINVPAALVGSKPTTHVNATLEVTP